MLSKLWQINKACILSYGDSKFNCVCVMLVCVFVSHKNNKKTARDLKRSWGRENKDIVIEYIEYENKAKGESNYFG